MSTLAPSPLPHHRFHLPKPRRLSQLGFLAGVAAGAVAWPLAGDHAVSFFAFIVVWYCVSYALPRLVQHDEHRRQWATHVLLFPVAAVVAALWIASAWDRHQSMALLLGLLAGALVQTFATHAFLRGVVHDQGHDLRHRIGIE
jgi:hypothetical protein